MTDYGPIFFDFPLAINELPYKKRMSRDNMILAGMWLSSKKPPMNVFLKPIYNSLLKLSKGITLNTPSKGAIVTKAFLLKCTADLPAQCMLTNSMQHNGEFSCIKCEQKGESVKSGKGQCSV